MHVYERTEIFAPQPRTLIVTPELMPVLGFRADEAILNRVHTLELCAGSRTVPIRLGEPDLIVERAVLLRMLARKAEAAGARVFRGQNLQGLETDGRRTWVHLRQRGTDRTQQIAARTIIGADGVRSQVARSVGYAPQPTVTVIQARVALPRSVDPGVGKVWFAPRETPYFYWMCPESADSAAVGIVDVSTRTARPKLDRFLRDRGMAPLEYQAALVPLYQPRLSPSRRLGRTDILLVGDAAGQVKVTTVGGTVSGLLGAQAAARAAATESSYARHARGVTRELTLHWWIRNLMSRLGDREYDALLHLVSGKPARLLEIHNRDRLMHGMWPIMTAQPRLSLLAAQVLWRDRAQA